ncbi:uncharacterized protein LOC112045413 [Bicyclus anynana]|uniref:Uncharacterized protein LOC112045413 n=1 Tax=Bicyclus anynana TaxID=110368 RepID=A0A6J1MP52_BICAN|nr:uncharacterized protein LOC112045413 [Bicyclus anynana]
MPKCKPVKNACKICFQQVTTKTGVQCQGACRTWIHFNCLNYTPGKIKDIKQGYITVTCPCPDCKSVAPKEFTNDKSTSCVLPSCPAKQTPRCQNSACPSYQLLYPHQNEQALGNGCDFSKCGQSDSSVTSGDIQSSTSTESLNVLEEMSKTVGQLKKQINCLANKMKRPAKKNKYCGNKQCRSINDKIPCCCGSK